MTALVLAALAWATAAPMPEARTEVAAAVVRGEIVLVGGLRVNGAPSARVDAYSPATDGWRRLPDLPTGVHHALAASDGRRLYVVGGYGNPLGGGGRPVRRTSTTTAPGMRYPASPSRALPGVRQFSHGKLYVLGGRAPGGLARKAFALDLATRRWQPTPAPTPREHLAVTAAAGKIYAVGGRLRGYDTNLRTFESWTPGARGWTRLAPLPGARGGTGAAAAVGQIVSVGGEAPSGTIRTVYAFDLATRHWRRLPDLPIPRHGLGVVAVGTRVYAIGGGTQPGLTVSDANEHIDLA